MICETIRQLTEYACRRGLISDEDRVYTVNRLLEAFGLDAYETDSEKAENQEAHTLAELLHSVVSYAEKKD